jgi:IS1 family transposase
MDELCIRVSPSLWLWTAVSRLVGQVVGFVIGDRTDAMLELAWSDVPVDYQEKPVYTDHLSAYAHFFAEGQHTACDKDSGRTSRVEALNTKWRQRHSGLVRRSCGVHRRIEDDLVERFFLLVDEHNRQCAKRWERQQKTGASTQINP